MKNLIKFCLVAIMILLPLACDRESLDISDDSVALSKSVNSKSTVDVYNVVLESIIGTSTLHRNKNGITVNFKTTDLTPGYAYTLWWVIWNKPEYCNENPKPCGLADFANAGMVEVELLYASGHVVGANGIGNFSAHLNENDASGSVNNAIFGLPSFGGLQNAETAEVHLVLRSHGPKVPGIVNEQIGSYLGGCPTEYPYGFAAFTEIPTEVGECGDIIASIHLAN